LPPEKADFNDLIRLMAKLRSPEGCPWDREQTHHSIKGHLVEEAFEVIDALDKGDFAELQEELGDLLLQVIFHSQMAAEEGRFSIDDVIDGIVTKLTRRHPHIFGESDAKTPTQVLRQWEVIKAGEKERVSYLSGVPESLPALAQSQKLQQKAARVGFDWRVSEDILDKLTEEVAEFLAAKKTGGAGRHSMEDEFGDILFTLVNLARHLNLDSELALRRVNQKFRHRFGRMEQLARERGEDFVGMSLEEKDKLWNVAKEEADDDN
jgi:tetrapyrrole methylase family protein / MazG family protein